MLRIISFLLLHSVAVTALAAQPARFEVSFSAVARSTPVDGRLIVILSKESSGEPRFQVTFGLQTAQVFGIDIDGLKPEEKTVIPPQVEGYPLKRISDVPAGTYTAQAVLNVYETFRKSDGHMLKLPMDQGEGQKWNESPGNLYSDPQQITLGLVEQTVSLEMTHSIPSIPEEKDTKYVRHVRIESQLLSEFWGRPMYLGALVLVPPGFDEHPEARYPVLYNQGHFSRYFPFVEAEPDKEEGEIHKMRDPRLYRFSQQWMAGLFPRMLIVKTQHATPYYDDSYGVNTANMGPYGDALTQELYPYIEQKFRAIGEPWSRIVYGGSTGGWMSLAQQIFYPDFFGGVWSFCPDPVDFHAFQRVNLYDDHNAYYDEGPFLSLPKPLARETSGTLLATTESFSRMELVLGTRGRSSGQFDAFHAVFGPVADDGYPAQLWDPRTGVIDPQVAAYWREHFDLTAILKGRWSSIGPKLVGKIHITMGTKDTFYLDSAVYLLEKFLEGTKEPGRGPYYGGSVEYGNNQPHCYVGDLGPNRLTVEERYLAVFAEQIRKMAPEGADVDSWQR